MFSIGGLLLCRNLSALCKHPHENKNKLNFGILVYNKLNTYHSLVKIEHIDNSETSEQTSVTISNTKETKETSEKDLDIWSTDLQELDDKYSVLQPCRTDDDISNVAPLFSPTFNFAAYINKSKTLQELVKLGVDLHQLEKKKGIPQFIFKLDFDRDMKEYIRFLHDHGVPPDQLGIFFTRNPLIFKEDLENLQVRINYLLSKRFSSDNISRIITKNPHWLSFSTRRIDRRLGHFQKSFSLKGQNYLLSRFNFVHNEMKLPHERITLHPQVLGSRLFRIKQRHLFLKSLDRAQYDPLKPGYISLDRLVAGTDAEFCERVANTSTEMFNMFLKTI
uniref:mTERF domain-containing protein 1, mitochondrial n=1 Tax=Timema monikensis TaxID=170555 RepID=A0A7R9E4W3_9NEOP|nr:unnamed protein product [Timema monikensis]